MTGAIILGVLAAFCVLAVPKLVDVNRYRPEVAAYLEKKTGKPAHIGHLELTLIPHFAIQADDVVLENPKGFPAGDFFKAQRVYALLEVRPLLDRKVVIKSLIVKNPIIRLICHANGRWNFENPPKPSNGTANTQDPTQAGFSLGEISEVTIDGGRVSVANLLASGEMGPIYFEGLGLSCHFQDVNVRALTASRRPVSSPSVANSLSPESPKIISADNNRSGLVAHGSLYADSLRFGAVRATSVDSDMRVFPRQVYLNNLTLTIAGGSARGKLAFDFSGKNLFYSVETRFQKIDVAQLLNAFPSARGKMTGTMDGKLDLNGKALHSSNPLGGLQGTGQVSVRNGRLPSLQPNKNLMLLVRMAGIGSPSGDPASFSLASADLNFQELHLISHHIRILSNDVDVTASGDVALTGSNQMDYRGIARVPAKQGGLTNLLASLSGATYANGKLAFPFDLRGTLDNPRFRLSSSKEILGKLPVAPAQSKPSGSGKQGSQPGNFVQDHVNLLGKKKASSTPPEQ